MLQSRKVWFIGAVLLPAALVGLLPAQAKKPATKDEPRILNVSPQPIAADKSVKYDYDIVYVRGRRNAKNGGARWAEFSRPTMMQPGADLMLLRPDGSEEVLVEGKDGSVIRASAHFR